MKHIKEFQEFINESIDNVNEVELKADKKAHKELSQAIAKADNVEDIWNQLDPKMFDVNLNDFEDIFNKWFNSQSSYDNVRDFAKNATTSDTQDLLNHLAKNIK
jgi:DNA repair exonuclease SbcCD ATPase subunit